LLLALYHLQSLGIDIISYSTPYDNFYYTIYLHSFAVLYTVTGLCRLQFYNMEGLYFPTEIHSSCHIHLIYLAWLISSLNLVLAFGQAVDCYDKESQFHLELLKNNKENGVVSECLWRGTRFGFPTESKAKLVPQTLTDG